MIENVLGVTAMSSLEITDIAESKFNLILGKSDF